MTERSKEKLTKELEEMYKEVRNSKNLKSNYKIIQTDNQSVYIVSKYNKDFFCFLAVSSKGLKNSFIYNAKDEARKTRDFKLRERYISEVNSAIMEAVQESMYYFLDIDLPEFEEVRYKDKDGNIRVASSPKVVDGENLKP